MTCRQIALLTSFALFVGLSAASAVDRPVPRPGDPAKAEAGEDLATRLGRIVLPTVSFGGVELREVAASLAVAAQDLDLIRPDEAVNILVLDTEEQAPLVRLELRNLSVRRVLDLLAEAAGFDCEIQEDAVLLRPGTGRGSLVTAYVPVSRATVARITGIVPAAAETAAGRAAAEGPALRAFLQQAGVGFDATGSSLAYDGSGAIVTNTAPAIARLRAILDRYARIRQVEIEARFLEVEQGVLDEIGLSWQVAKAGEAYDTGGSTRSLARAFSGAQSDSAITINGVRVAGTQPPRLPGEVAVGGAAAPLVALDTSLGEFDLRAAIRALSQRQGTDLLSAPRVTVLSGQLATITVAQEMRYPQSYGEIQSQVGSTAGGGSGGSGSAGVTITSGTPLEFTMRKVGVELRCTPTVESDGASISLELNPRVTEFEGFVEYGGPSLAISAGTSVTVPPGFYQPVFSVREISTRVILANGATLVLGGLTREAVKQVEDRVPVLGSLPVLGRLFRSTAKSTQKRTLLIFVTATLVDANGSRVSP